jgi:hypothetical protein
MKKFLVFLGLFYALGLSAQYKYQIKANLLVRNGGITNGFNLGFETLHKKTNFLIDFQTFGDFYNQNREITKVNQQYFLTVTNINTNNIGVNLGVITSLSEGEKLSLNGGIKVFLGRHTKATKIEEYVLDSSKFGFEWLPKDRRLNLNNIPTTYIYSFAFGAIPFIRMDAKLSPRFFLIPEIQLPLTGFANKQDSLLDFNIGFNISLAYRFSKNKFHNQL